MRWAIPVRLQPAGLASIVVGLCLGSGCGLEAPEAPTFETEVHLPIGDLSYTVAELIESQAHLEGDTTAASSVYLTFDGTIDSIDVRDRLVADIASTRLAAEVGELSLDVTTIPEIRFLLGDYSPIEIPPEGTVMTVPAYEFRPVTVDLPSFPEYVEGTLRAGFLDLLLHNDTSIPIEGFVVQIEDLLFESVIGTIGEPGRIEPDSTYTRSIDLAGRRISNTFRIRILSGHSPGSEEPVPVDPSDGIEAETELVGLRFERIEAPIPPKTFQRSDSTAVAGKIRILQATVSSTSVPLRLESRIPVPVSVELTLAELEVDRAVWKKTFVLPAGSAESPAVIVSDEPLDGSTINFPFLTTPQRLHYDLRVDYDGSGGEVVSLSEEMGVTAEIGAFQLRLAELTGIIEPQEIEIRPTRTDFGIPEETEGLEFVEANLTLEIVNEVRVPGRLTMTAAGSTPDGTVIVHLEGDVDPATEAGPTTTRRVWDQDDSNVVDLVNLRPEEITVSGTVQVGDSTVVSIITSDDTISGRYEIRSPVRVRIEETEYRPDPYEFEIADEIQDRIRDQVIDAEATLVVLNHLPFGVMLAMQFAADSIGVYERPSVVFDRIRVPAGTIDPLTGRVVEGTVSEVEIRVSSEDVAFFARNLVYGGASIQADPTDGQIVELSTTDMIEVRGILRFRIRVE